MSDDYGKFLAKKSGSSRRQPANKLLYNIVGIPTPQKPQSFILPPKAKMPSTTAVRATTLVEPDMFDTSDNEEIKRIWAKVKQSVIALAGSDPSQINLNLNIDGVLKYLENAQEENKKSLEAYSEVKAIFRRTLQCIGIVGGIVTEGASYVFAPAGTCYNALTFVIKVWQGYEGIFESLAGLLEKCAEFFDRLGEYVQAGIDSKLTMLACQHLQLFVDICQRTMEMRHKHLKILAVAKLFFLNDDGVKGLLGQMKSLVDKEFGLVAAQAFRFAKEGATISRDGLALGHSMDNKIDLLVEDKTQQKQKDESQKWTKTILEALGFDRPSIRDGAPTPTWLNLLNRYKSSVVEGTGKWILDEPQFVAWAKNTNPLKAILVLEGPDGSGKTYMMVNALRHLRKMDGLGRNTVFAYYFLDSEPKDPVAKADILESVSRSLLWQLAASYEPFTKSVANISERVREFDTPAEMWTRLLFENEETERLDMKFFVLVDGLDDSMETFIPLIQKLYDGSGNRLRLLLTAKPRSIKLLSNLKGASFGIVQISSKNSADIELYITSRIDSMEILKDTSRPGISEWRSKVLSVLRDKTAGDYFKLVTNLDRIEKVDLAEDINEVLENAGKPLSDHIEAEIRRLNKTRTAKEIWEINEIILWLNGACEALMPDQIDAVLSVRPAPGSDDSLSLKSLLPLDAKLRTKYTLFEINHSGKIDYKSPETKDCIPSRDQSLLGNSGIDGNYISGGLDIQVGEVSMVKHFLRTVCPQEIYEKFGFDQYLDMKVRRTNHYIFQDLDNAEIRIAITCLRVLTEKRDEKTKNLHAYAGEFLLSHLQKTDLSLADRDLKAQAGCLLVKLFTDEHCIDSMFWAIVHEEMDYTNWVSMVYVWTQKVRSAWVYRDDGVKELARWFKDTAVVRGVTGEKDKKWLADFTCPGSNAYELLLCPAAHRMAWRMLKDAFWAEEVYTAFFFLNGYKHKVSNPGGFNEPKSSEDIWEPTKEQVMQVLEFARTLLSHVAEDSETSLQNMDVFGYFTSYVLPEKEFMDDLLLAVRKALKTDPGDWRAAYNFVKSTDSREDAIKQANETIERLEDDKEWIQIPRNRYILSLLLLELIVKYLKSESDDDFNLAVQASIRCLNLTPTDGNLACSHIVLTAKRRARWNDIISCVETLNRHRSSWNEYKQMLEDLYRSRRFNDAVLQAIDETNRWDVLHTMYKPAIEMATSKRAGDELCWFRYCYGYGLSLKKCNEGLVLELWEKVIDHLPKLQLWRTQLVWPFVHNLAPIYLDNALAAGSDSETASRYLTKIRNMIPTDNDASNEYQRWYDAQTPALYLARYYQIRGNTEKGNKEIRPAMEECLALLSDNDDENDEVAFLLICSICASCDDEINAIAAFQIVVLNYIKAKFEFERKNALWEKRAKTVTKAEPASGDLPESNEPAADNKPGPEISEVVVGALSLAHQKDDSNPPVSSDREATGTYPRSENSTTQLGDAKPKAQGVEDSEDTPPEEPIPYLVCDGECETELDAGSVWCCQDCVGQIHFEEGCYKKLIEGKLVSKMCNITHKFIKIPKINKEWVDIPKSCIYVKNNLITLEEWKEELRMRYLDFNSIS